MGVDFSKPQSKGRIFIANHARQKHARGEQYQPPYEWHNNTCTIHDLRELFPTYTLVHDLNREHDLYEDMVGVNDILMHIIQARNKEEYRAYRQKHPSGFLSRNPSDQHKLSNTTFDCDDPGYDDYVEKVQQHWTQEMLPHFHIQKTPEQLHNDMSTYTPPRHRHERLDRHTGVSGRGPIR